MKSIDISFSKTAIGELIVGSYEQQLCLLDFHYRKMRKQVDARLKSQLNSSFKERKSAVCENAIEQLEQYLSKERKCFDLPLLTPGTEFQNKVWQALMSVEYGETASYQQIANKIGQPQSVRAVAAANGANAIAIIIPCHRIIGSDGSLTGYGGGLQTKKNLLQLEGSSAQMQLL